MATAAKSRKSMVVAGDNMSAAVAAAEGSSHAIASRPLDGSRQSVASRLHKVVKGLTWEKVAVPVVFLIFVLARAMDRYENKLLHLS